MRDLRKYIATTIREYLNENINNTLPIKKINKVFHIGEMDIKKKSKFSLEGSGLSVSKKTSRRPTHAIYRMLYGEANS